MKRFILISFAIFSLSLLTGTFVVSDFGTVSSPPPDTVTESDEAGKWQQAIPGQTSAEGLIFYASSNPLKFFAAYHFLMLPYFSLNVLGNTLSTLTMRNFLVITILLTISLLITLFLWIHNYRARSKVQKSEESFKDLLEASPSAIMIFQNFRLFYVNTALEKLTGFERKELLDMEIWQLIDPESLRNLNNDQVFVQHNGFNFRSEFQIITKSKEKRWIDFSTRSIDFEGKHAVLASSVDITDKKNYEQKLIAAEERYALIVLATSDGVWDYDIVTDTLYLSDQWMNMLGYHKDELESKLSTWISLVHENDQLKVNKILDKLISGNSSSFKTEYRMRCKDGQYKWIAASFSVVFGKQNKALRILGTHSDITERKMAIERLKESELRYKSFFSKNSAVMLIIEPDTGKIQFANQAAVDYYGYDADSLRQMNILDINIMDSEEVRAEEQNAEKEERSYHYFKHKLADGSIRDVEVYSSTMHIRSQTLQYIIVFDITKRIQAEKDLQKAKDEAEEANKVKSLFVSNVSHEIRTPLNAIIGLTELITDEQDLSPQLRENIKSIKYSSDHLLDVINDVLDFSKLEAGKVVLEQTDFDIFSLVKESSKTIGFKAKEKGITTRVDIQPNIPKVLKGDPSRLKQILLNLLSNAVKFTSEGSIDIKVNIMEMDGSRVNLKFAVSDTGIGIPEDVQSTIFESFMQAASDTSRKYGGTGLGLSICKKLVDLQKGTIGLESSEGAGSTFWFTISYLISEKAYLPDISRLGGQRKSLQDVKILLVEDDKMNQFVMKQLLKKWHAELEIAENGQEAIDLLSVKKFDLVLMDLHMPHLNGYEATAIIRDPSSAVLDHKVMVIALTADVTAETKERVQKAGMNDFISKPCDQEIIFEKIHRSILNKKTEFVEKKQDEELRLEVEKPRNENIKLRIKKALADIFDDDLESTLSLISRFLKEIPRTIIGINEAFYDKDYETLGKLVHKIKPGYSYMGFSEVTGKIHKIQMLTKDLNDLQELEKLCKELDDASRDIIRLLREIQSEYIKNDSVNMHG